MVNIIKNKDMSPAVSRARLRYIIYGKAIILKWERSKTTDQEIINFIKDIILL